MSELTSQEQAQLERTLAIAHRVVWRLVVLYQGRDDYDTADDLNHIAGALAGLMDVELRRGRTLRTRPRNRA